MENDILNIGNSEFKWLQIDSCLKNPEAHYESYERELAHELSKVQNFILSCKEKQEYDKKRCTEIKQKEEYINELKLKKEDNFRHLNDLKIKETELKASTDYKKLRIQGENKILNRKSEESSRLASEVAQLENIKEEDKQKIISKRNTILKMMSVYKSNFNCRIDYKQPDIFTFYFSSQKVADNTKCVVFRSDDLTYWELVDIPFINDVEYKKKLFDQYHNLPIGLILCKIRSLLERYS